MQVVNVQIAPMSLSGYNRASLFPSRPGESGVYTCLAFVHRTLFHVACLQTFEWRSACHSLLLGGIRCGEEDQRQGLTHLYVITKEPPRSAHH